MGLVASFLFPILYMDRHQPVASTSTDRPASPKQDLPPLSPLSDRAPSPSPFGPSSSGPQRAFHASPPLAPRPFSPHAVGLGGVLAPQPVFGPFLPPLRDKASPVQHRSSPTLPQSNPIDALLTRYTAGSPAGSPLARPAAALGEPPPLPLSPSLGAANEQSGLHISLPPLHPTSSSSTPSPPLFSPPILDPIPISPAESLDASRPQHVGGNVALEPADIAVPWQVEPSLDYTDLDADGLSALEKIYLFSRSRAGFHRVFIAHALPRYLGTDTAPDAQYPSREESDQISPSEAVEYVLPLLPILAMDDDEQVKEALAAELVPIIWWFVTHCRVVEEEETTPQQLAPPNSPSPSQEIPPDFPFPAVDHPPPSSVPLAGPLIEPPVVPARAFTPILGTLLLSQNGLVGGPARYAVVELLKRLRRADEREGTSPPLASSAQPRDPRMSPTLRMNVGRSTTETDTPDDVHIGLLGRAERRLFEREIVFQVVIGMGRLDMPDESAPWAPQGEDAPLSTPNAGAGASNTANMPTPIAVPPQVQDSYFPVMNVGSPAVFSPRAAGSPHVEVPPPPSPMGLPIAGPLPSPPVARTAAPPAFTGSAASSSSSLESTPSLTSSSSSSLSSGSGSLFETPTITATRGTPPLESPQFSVPLGQRMEEIAEEMQGVDEFAQDDSKVALAFTPPSPPPAAPADIEAAVSEQAAWSDAADAEGATDLDVQMLDEIGDLDNGYSEEEAAVGRLSSMSLMAAVTASGAIAQDTCDAFVTEVERVGRDPVYWVRREATFAVGALAKVVPHAVVISSLLPLFQALVEDSTWHVRHSVLYALPAILARLSLPERRSLALSVILPLARDEHQTVRSGVLEALGEVIYTFADDPEGPPRQLLNLFLGIREEGTAPPVHSPTPRQPDQLLSASSQASSGWGDFSASSDVDIYEDPARPLVCAFSYPAVTLTLGRARWPELRAIYRALAQDQSWKVRRTLAAALGEMAKIIGPEHARADLLEVWTASVHAEESEVRLKAIECADVFVRALARPQQEEVMSMLEADFRDKRLKGWREREELAKRLDEFAQIEGVEEAALHRLLSTALEDNTAAVREAAVGVVPAFVRTWRNRPQALYGLRAVITALAREDSYRKRTMFIRCEQAIIMSDHGAVVISDDSFWEALSALIKDDLVDVRIQAARLLSTIAKRYIHDGSIMQKVSAHAHEVFGDPSQDVQAFAEAILSRSLTRAVAAPTEATKSAFTFSRPPPPPP